MTSPTRQSLQDHHPRAALGAGRGLGSPGDSRAGDAAQEGALTLPPQELLPVTVSVPWDVTARGQLCLKGSAVTVTPVSCLAVIYPREPHVFSLWNCHQSPAPGLGRALSLCPCSHLRMVRKTSPFPWDTLGQRPLLPCSGLSPCQIRNSQPNSSPFD